MLAGHTAWAGIATFGSFAALYARDTHYRSRGRVVAAAGLGLVAAGTIGTLAALTPAPAIPAVVAVSLVGAAALIGWLIAMAGAAVDRDAPRRLAVARALRAAAAAAEAGT
ncbi:hypothetical protein [Winogradskya humida]|uniref:Uncharacterized protein n=1 Tax=Winogradskya humida TaxID=113566 RepID=A0ABQ3ZJ84_9ACTN|nr:hypothetical protein [Actinoplanes humidus]GIE18640.1 hypothetical protein Ahu01nite_017420 [Actinoplanes humidus]